MKTELINEFLCHFKWQTFKELSKIGLHCSVLERGILLGIFWNTAQSKTCEIHDVRFLSEVEDKKQFNGWK